MSTGAAETAAPVLAESIALRGMRGTIARRMTESLRHSAQLTLHSTCDPTGLFGAHAVLKTSEGPAQVSLNDLLLFAVARTLQEHPSLNATVDDETIYRWRSVNLGFAVALEDGLIVPVIRDCQDRELAGIAIAAHDLSERARLGRLTIADVSDGTFTVTNLGTFGIDHFTPIVNPPQVAILGVGRATPQGLGLSLTIDHRALDGAVGARFLSALGLAIASMDLSDEGIIRR